MVVLDIGLDTRTDEAAPMLRLMLRLAEFDTINNGSLKSEKRRRRRQRPRGRPSRLQGATRERIVRLHDAGWSYARIARELQRDGVKTLQGGKMWYRSTVAYIVKAAQNGS